MKLQLIKLTNFRQFKGTQAFDLTSDKVKPVTLLFGANGAGKTTLLNAFTWGLYGNMSEDVEQQHRMVTDSVWRTLPVGDSIEVAVEVRFDHEGQDYRLLRSATFLGDLDRLPRLEEQGGMGVAKLVHGETGEVAIRMSLQIMALYPEERPM